MDWLFDQTRALESLAPDFASSIGRPDLARRALRILPSGTSTSDRDSGMASQGAAAQLASASSKHVAVGLLNGGSITAGTLGIMTIALVGFYLWTRGHQA